MTSSPRRQITAVLVACATLLGVVSLTTTSAEAQPAERPDRSSPSERLDRIQERIDDGVESGRISAEQAERLQQRLADRAARIADGASPEELRAERQERRAEHRAARQQRAAAIADIIGIDVETMIDALKAGQSLRDLAVANGVDVQDLIDHLTDAANSRLDAAIESGRIDADAAEERRAQIGERVDALIDGELERRGHRGPRNERGGD